VTTIAFFNNKRGVGTTTLVYHLSFMAARLGHRVVAADFDPQADLTSAFFDQVLLSKLSAAGGTVSASIGSMLSGLQDAAVPNPVAAAEDLWVLPGDISLSRFEDGFSESWLRAREGDEAGITATAAFHRLILRTASTVEADVVLIDVGTGLSAIVRAALLAADWVIVPVLDDLLSLQSLRSLGPTLRDWRRIWSEMGPTVPAGIDTPRRTIEFAGYVSRHSPGLVHRIADEFHNSVLGHPMLEESLWADQDPWRLGSLHNYRSLMSLALEARKPMFDLRPADGALGSIGRYVSNCEREFRRLSEVVLRRTAVDRPPARGE
jgi:chromosome partitioning protein